MRNAPRILLFLCAIVLSQSVVARAEGLQPLTEVVEHAAKPYPHARCAALHQAMMEWIGKNRMGDDLWETSDTFRQQQILESVVIYQQESGGTMEETVEVVVRDVRNIADLYLKRMEANYAAVGQAFGDDKLITGDLEFCQAISSSP